MKKKPAKKLSLSRIKVTSLSSSGAQRMHGGFASGPTGPTGPAGATAGCYDPCATQYEACTMCCTLDCYTVNTPGCLP